MRIAIGIISFCLIAVSFFYILYFRFTHSDMTETRLFLEVWKPSVLMFISCGVFMGVLLKPEEGEKP